MPESRQVTLQVSPDHQPDALDYVARHYGVPAKLGGRVMYLGRPGTESSLQTVTPRFDANDAQNPSCIADVLADLTEQVARLADHVANIDKNGIEVWRNAHQR